MQKILQSKRNFMAMLAILILLATACVAPAIEPAFGSSAGSSVDDSALESIVPLSNDNSSAVDDSNTPKVSLQMKGIVEKIEDNELQINGKTFSIDSETSIDDVVSAGDQIEVKFSEASDGALMALKIELINLTGDDDSIDDSADDSDDVDDDSADDSDDDSADDSDDDSADDSDDDSADDSDDDSADDSDDDSADDSDDDDSDDSHDSDDDSHDGDDDSDDGDDDSDDGDDDSHDGDKHDD